MIKTDGGYRLSSGRVIPSIAGGLRLNIDVALADEGVPLTPSERIEIAELAMAQWLIWSRPTDAATASGGSEYEFTDAWGATEGKPRKPCPARPDLWPASDTQRRCQRCGLNLVPAAAHPFPSANYEVENGHDWPPGYLPIPSQLKWTSVPKAKGVRAAQVSAGTVAFIQKTPDSRYGLMIDCRMVFRAEEAAQAYTSNFAALLLDLDEKIRTKTL